MRNTLENLESPLIIEDQPFVQDQVKNLDSTLTVNDPQWIIVPQGKVQVKTMGPNKGS